ncbi:MAG: DJ-1/PfpI family protein, partial [Clostridia bacterium]|nr:DJ-1/PfpI family protein [Clostridia bacterium]
QQIIGQALKQDKWVAAICAAPTILGKQGYLSGREAVCYPGCEEDLKGASIGTKNVVKCGNIITSKGAGTAVDFSLAIVAALRGEELAEKIKKQIIYHQ